MNTIFMNSKNSKVSDPHRLLLNLTNNIDLRRLYKGIVAFTIHEKIWKSHIRTINSKLPDESYSISDIQDYFGDIITNHEEKSVNPSIRIYKNKIENRIMFKIKTGFYLELLTPETMQLLGTTASKTAKDKNGENVSYLEIAEVVLIHWNVLNNSYQQNSRVLYTFVPNNSFGQLLDISPEIIFLKNIWFRIFLY